MAREELIKMVKELTPAEREEIIQALNEEAGDVEELTIPENEQERLVMALRSRGLTLRRWTTEEIEGIWGVKPRLVSYEELDAAMTKLKSPLSEQIIRDRGVY